MKKSDRYAEKEKGNSIYHVAAYIYAHGKSPPQKIAEDLDMNVLTVRHMLMSLRYSSRILECPRNGGYVLRDGITMEDIEKLKPHKL